MRNIEGIQEKFEEAYETHAAELYRHAFFRLSDGDRATDAVQETFCKTWIYLRDGNVIGHMRGFLYRVLSNVIIDARRKKTALSLETLTEEGFDPPGNSHETIEREAAYREIVRLLDKLREEHRTILIMRYVNGLSPKDIAPLLGVSENVVSVRIHRALEKLKILFEGPDSPAKTSHISP